MNKYIYTNNNSDTSANIYFLNDKNIISEINDNVSGLNPIASYDLVKNLSSTAREAISELNQDLLQYFKLSANNIITESNTFEKTQTFDKISVDTVYSDFSKIFNRQEGKLSDIINGIVDTTTIGNIHRTIQDICVYANLTTVVADDIELDDMLVSSIKSIKSIINEKPNELLVHSNIVKFNDTDLDEIINTYTIKDYLEVLNTIANSLDIDTYAYSLADRLKQIEKSVDALDKYLTRDTDSIKTAINNISSDVSNITASIDLSSNDKLSIITNIQQIAGKITVDGTELLSNHVKGLTSYGYETNRMLSSISSTISSLSNHISSTYAMCSDIPLSTSQLINDGCGNGSFIGRNEIKLSSGYINDTTYELQILTEDNEILAKLLANDFIQDGMLQSVELKYLDTNDHKSGVLEFTWNIHEGSADRSMQVPLSSLIDNLYKGKDGINVNDYEISPDYSKIAAVSSVNNLCSMVTLISNDYCKRDLELSSVLSDYINGISTDLSNDYCKKDLELSSVLSAYINGISTDLSNDYCKKDLELSSVLSAYINGISTDLSNAISSKIIIDGTPVLSVELQHISQDDYHNLVLNNDGPLSNVLYIVSSDSLNMYDERIINLADPISATDGVTKQYADNISTILSNDYHQRDLTLSNTLSTYVNNKFNSISSAIANNDVLNAIQTNVNNNSLENVDHETLINAVYALINILSNLA